jgi:uncharacterized protein (TIGR01777 family)
MARTFVTGASGVIGRRLIRALDDAIVSSRREPRVPAGSPRAVRWDPARELAPREALEGTDAIIHLAGEPLAEGRWTARKKESIRESRIRGTRHLVDALEAVERRPRVLVSASAVGIYGDRGDELLDEGSAIGDDFLARLCREWEEEAMAATRFGVRVVCARIGVVLSPDGGAIPKMLPAFRIGVSGKLASGAQWMPWIHIDDAVSLLLLAASDERVNGPLNVVAPEPATNAEFTHALAAAVRRPAMLRIPRFALRLAFGELAEVMLASQRVMPKRAIELGHRFRHRDVGSAVRAAIADEAA